MDDDVVLCRALGRYKIFVDRSDFGLSTHLMLDGFWQMWVTQAVLATVREGMFVADVGANVGYYTLLLADLVGNSGHVHATEQNSRNLRLLDRSVTLNGFTERVVIHGDPTLDREVFSRPSPSSRGARNVSMSSMGRSSAGMQVPKLRNICLDDEIQDAKLDFVKIDASYAARDIWGGMQRIVGRNQPLTIFLEFVVARYPDPDVFLAEFEAANFKLARINSRGELLPLAADDILNFPSNAGQPLSLSR